MEIKPGTYISYPDVLSTAPQFYLMSKPDIFSKTVQNWREKYHGKNRAWQNALDFWVAVVEDGEGLRRREIKLQIGVIARIREKADDR